MYAKGVEELASWAKHATHNKHPDDQRKTVQTSREEFHLVCCKYARGGRKSCRLRPKNSVGPAPVPYRKALEYAYRRIVAAALAAGALRILPNPKPVEKSASPRGFCTDQQLANCCSCKYSQD